MKENATERDCVIAKAGEPIGQMRENGVVWFDKNPHAYPLGTYYYAAQPDTEALRQRVKGLETERDFLHHKAECLNMERQFQDKQLATQAEQIKAATSAFQEILREDVDRHVQAICQEALAKLGEQR